MIDWEFSSIAQGHELAYIKVHSHPSEAQFDTILKLYAHYSSIYLDELCAEVSFEEKIIRLHDVIWAAMKWGQMKDSVEERKYQKLTETRIDMFLKIVA